MVAFMTKHIFLITPNYIEVVKLSSYFTCQSVFWKMDKPTAIKYYSSIRSYHPGKFPAVQKSLLSCY